MSARSARARRLCVICVVVKRRRVRVQECLCEANPMELIVPMPVLLFKPVENKKRGAKGIYSCPLYMYPVRTGTRERPSFMINVDLKAGASDPDHWVMRGTALLLALSA